MKIRGYVTTCPSLNYEHFNKQVKMVFKSWRGRCPTNTPSLYLTPVVLQYRNVACELWQTENLVLVYIFVSDKYVNKDAITLYSVTLTAITNNSMCVFRWPHAVLCSIARPSISVVRYFIFLSSHFSFLAVLMLLCRKVIPLYVLDSARCLSS